MAIRDTRMMAKALEQRWPLDPMTKRGIIAKLIQVIKDPESSPREITSAAKALLAAERQNQADEHKVIDVSIQARNAELDAIAADLGIEASVIGYAEGQSGGGNLGVETNTDSIRREI